MTIATVIAAGRLDERLIEQLLELNPGASFVRWIDEGDAADIEFEGDAALPDGIDQVVQGPGAREKKLLVADMDSTMIGQECIDELADYAGIKPQIAAITERAMQGDLDFAEALAERVALLRALPEETLALCLRERIRPNPGARTLVRTMVSRGAEALLVSGGFTAFVEPVAGLLGFTGHRANRLGISHGRLTGTTEGPIIDAAAKKDAMELRRRDLGLPADSVMAIGDGANDLPMVEAAGLGVAYHAKPALARAADARIDHHGLDALLWAQGIPKADWIID